ncbi:putative peroxisomal membrane protein [Pseudovirgaria hyperparasitica]|uniref:Putative peroxisomal membrane protein n=1 Tax=Pseudovirgaria hyperparasitica TaxID=470096 RepID=A0A6A6W3E7_9PEZI|nr:putative peroxisomal membrane protein [Pseudovirgaria hyperparasitica]KAF2756659.1 putative peroxisomal membrane protein [Pseudovirgaria hyperparasitica]
MDKLGDIHAALERIALDPKYHDILSLVKGMRNGIVYGSKIRFPHALVMILLFRSGTLRQKIWLVLKATRQHAMNLGTFAVVYKSTMLALKQLPTGKPWTEPPSKEGPYDSFVAGLLGGYVVFGRSNSSVNQQIVIYVFARVMLALAKLLVKPVGEGKGGGGMGLVNSQAIRDILQRNAWPAFASLSWASVMFLFRWHPDIIQSSLRSSMSYIYVQSDDWDSLRTLLWHNK